MPIQLLPGSFGGCVVSGAAGSFVGNAAPAGAWIEGTIMRAQTEPVVFIGARSREYKSFTGRDGSTIPAGVRGVIEVKDGDGPVREYRADLAVVSKAAGLTMGSEVVMMIEVYANGSVKVLAVAAAPAKKSAA